MNKMTRQQTVITIIVAIIFASCALLDAYDVVPRFKKALAIIQLPCLVYLLFVWRAYRRKIRDSASYRAIETTYYYVFRFAGFWFLILGSIMTPFLAAAVLANQPGYTDSSAWGALLGCAGLTIIGFLIVRFRPFKHK